MKQALIVGAGGFGGCIARYLVGVLVTRLLNAPVFPYATLLVNIVGCLLIGVLGGLAQSTRVLSPELQLLLITACSAASQRIPPLATKQSRCCAMDT